jgi:hypothetical protein
MGDVLHWRDERFVEDGLMMRMGGGGDGVVISRH